MEKFQLHIFSAVKIFLLKTFSNCCTTNIFLFLLSKNHCSSWRTWKEQTKYRLQNLSAELQSFPGLLGSISMLDFFWENIKRTAWNNLLGTRNWIRECIGSAWIASAVALFRLAWAVENLFRKLFVIYLDDQIKCFNLQII